MAAEDGNGGSARRRFWLDVAVAGVLGLTAIATAWAAYRATEVRDQSSGASTHGNRVLNLGTSYLLHSDQIDAHSREIFLEYTRAGNPRRAAYVKRVLMSPRLRAEVGWWERQKPGTYPGPFVREDPNYRPIFRIAGRELRVRSRLLFEDSDTLGNEANRYELVTVVLAAALFLVGLAGVFRDYRFRVALLVIGTVFFVGSVAQLARVEVKGVHFSCEQRLAGVAENICK